MTCYRDRVTGKESWISMLLFLLSPCCDLLCCACLVRGVHQCSKKERHCQINVVSHSWWTGAVCFCAGSSAMSLTLVACFPLGLLEIRPTCSVSSCACQELWQLLHLAWPQEHQGHPVAHESSLCVTKLCRQQGKHEGNLPQGPQGKSWGLKSWL